MNANKISKVQGQLSSPLPSLLSATSWLIENIRIIDRTINWVPTEICIVASIKTNGITAWKRPLEQSKFHDKRGEPLPNFHSSEFFIADTLCGAFLFGVSLFWAFHWLKNNIFCGEIQVKFCSLNYMLQHQSCTCWSITGSTSWFFCPGHFCTLARKSSTKSINHFNDDRWNLSPSSTSKFPEVMHFFPCHHKLTKKCWRVISTLSMARAGLYEVPGPLGIAFPKRKMVFFFIVWREDPRGIQCINKKITRDKSLAVYSQPLLPSTIIMTSPTY